MKRKELTKTFISVHNDFKLKKTLWSPWFIQKYVSVVSVKGLIPKPVDYQPCNVGLMLGQRRRRWPNIKPTLLLYQSHSNSSQYIALSNGR